MPPGDNRMREIREENEINQKKIHGQCADTPKRIIDMNINCETFINNFITDHLFAGEKNGYDSESGLFPFSIPMHFPRFL